MSDWADRIADMILDDVRIFGASGARDVIARRLRTVRVEGEIAGQVDAQAIFDRAFDRAVAAVL